MKIIVKVFFILFHSKVRVTAVDIDPVMLDMATTYFGLVQDERLDVYIRDGVQYVLQAAEKGNFTVGPVKS